MNGWTSEEVKQNPEMLGILTDLLFQLADDDFILGYRDQEWLGLAPHIEEDVAFGSIAQEEIGHAAFYYQLLENLGVGRADDLASLRSADQHRNAVLLERPNGEHGDFLNQPHFDWAWTIVRHYLYDVWDMARLNVLKECRFVPLAEAADKILGEKRYHRAHQELWIRTMATHDTESRQKLEHALVEASRWVGDLVSFGRFQTRLEETGVIPSIEPAVRGYWAEVESFLHREGLAMPEISSMMNGRLGEHTDALTTALSRLSEVYRLDPSASW